MRLAERVAIVTGGGSGIGRAIADRFAREGASVVVADIATDNARAVANEINDAGGQARAIEADVRDSSSVESMVSETIDTFGKVDILVNNAGAAKGDDITTIDEETWDFNVNLVLKGAYLCARAVLPHMIERRTGSIVNISSVNGMTGLGEEAYGAAKAGVGNLTQNMAVKYGQYGVRANCICPGTVRTPVWEPRLKENPDILDRLSNWYPLGRVGRPDEIASAALYFASDEASWTTGVIMPVDGGLTAGTYRMSKELLGDA